MGDRTVRIGLFLLTVLSFLIASASGKGVIVGTLVATLLIAQFSEPSRRHTYFGYLLGALVSAAPLLSGPAGLCGALSIVLLSAPWERASWILPVAFILCMWIISDGILFAIDAAYLAPEILSSFSFETIDQWMHRAVIQAPPRLLLELSHLHGILLLATALAAGGQVPQIRQGAITSACVLLPIGVCVAAIQGSTVIHVPFLELPAFWRDQGRVAALFSDPNAAGVASALVLAIVILTKTPSPRLAFWGGGAACVLGLLSGSRTFILACITLPLLLLWNRSRRAAIFVMFVGAVCVGAFWFIAAEYQIGTRAFVAEMPLSLQRTLQTFQPEFFQWSSLSRRAFWDIAIAVARDNLLAGVGPQSFREIVTPYAQELGHPIGLWSDNSNSFYLGILAELGLLGVGAWILALRALAFKVSPSSRLSTAAPFAALLLLTGPHTDFVEVSVLLGLLLSFAVAPSSPGVRSQGRWAAAVFWVFGAGVIAAHSLDRQRGLYAFEEEGGQQYRWTAPRALIHLPCTSNGAAHLSVRVFHKNRSGAHPLVTVIGPFHRRDITAPLGAWVDSAIPCRPAPSPPGMPAQRTTIPVTIEVRHGWVPLLWGAGEDPRLLGAQIRIGGKAVASPHN